MMAAVLKLLLLLATLQTSCCTVQRFSASPSFAIDYENNTFTLDGAPFRYVSGTVHYFRVPRTYWADRLLRLRALGANVLETYVEWSSHEPEQEQYQFTGELVQEQKQFIDESVHMSGTSSNVN